MKIKIPYIKYCFQILSPLLLSSILLTFGILSQKNNLFFRYWDDVKQGIGFYLHNQILLTSDWDESIIKGLKKNEFYEFWKTSPKADFINEKPQASLIVDDIGRGLLLGLGFKMLDGVSPYLIFWIGPLLTILLFLWMLIASYKNGCFISTTALVLVLSISSFFAGSLTTSYGSQGFYLIGILSLLILFQHFFFSTHKSVIGTMLYTLLCGVVFGIAVLARNGTILLLPGVLLALVLFINEKQFINIRTAALKGCIIILLFIIFMSPYLFFRMKINSMIQHEFPEHPVWHALWCGMGDFDDQKGYSIDDFESAKFVNNVANIEVQENCWRTISRDHENVVKNKILYDIFHDPLWYLKILWKRFIFTFFQTKILPWRLTHGYSMMNETSPSKQFIDNYYSLVPTADKFIIGTLEFELPLIIFFIPGFFIFIYFFYHLQKNKVKKLNILTPQIKILLCCGVSCLSLPIIVTTFGGIETQAFMIFYFLAFAYNIENFLLAVYQKFKKSPEFL